MFIIRTAIPIGKLTVFVGLTRAFLAAFLLDRCQIVFGR